MFLAYNSATGFGNRFQYRFFIKRLYGVYVYQFYRKTFRFQLLCGFNGFPNQMTGSEDGNIVAFIHHNSLTEFKASFRHKNRPCRATEAQINRSDMFCRSYRGFLGLIVIAGINNHHTGQHLHKADVFQYLVRGSVFAQRNTGVRSSYLYILATISHALADLVINTTGSKVGEGSSERNFAADGHTRCNTDHVRFGYTHLHITLGELLDKLIQFQRTRKVGTQGYHVRILSSKFQNTDTKTRTGVLFPG